MDMDIIFRLMIRQNPWWANGAVPHANLPKRNIFDKIHAHLHDRFVLSITGPRRVGKTTLLYQLINELLKNGVKETHIFYLSFDELITKEGADIIETILEIYRGRILKRPWGKEEIYVLFDEIQYVPLWQSLLKRVYDLNYKVKFFVSGSSSTEIQKGKESLAGRLFNFSLLYLDFTEFLRINGFQLKHLPEKGHIQNLEESYHQALLYERDLKDHFYQYLLGGGFPELIGISSLDDKQEYILNAVVDKVIFKDLPQALSVKDTRLLMELLMFAAAYSSQLFEIIQMSKHFKVSRETASNYVEYLRKGFLIETSYTYSPAIIKGVRANKKIYVRDTGILHSMMRYTEKDIANPAISGRSVETLFFALLKAHYPDVWFWRDAAKHEVDLVLRTAKSIAPVEIKYRNSISSKDISGLLYFMDKFRLKTGWVITFNTFRTVKYERKTVHLIPAYFAATVIDRLF